MVLGQLDTHMQKNEVGLFHIMWKVSSKCINDLYIRVKTMKLLEENKRGKLHDLEFLETTPKAWAKKEKNWTL